MDTKESCLGLFILNNTLNPNSDRKTVSIGGRQRNMDTVVDLQFVKVKPVIGSLYFQPKYFRFRSLSKSTSILPQETVLGTSKNGEHKGDLH